MRPNHRPLSVVPISICIALCAACVEERVALELELDGQPVFLHADTLEITLHAPRAGQEPINTCDQIETELVGSGFSVPPFRRVGPIAPCDFLAGIEIPDLPVDTTLYVAAVRDGSGTLIAYGCQHAALEELQITDEGARHLSIQTEITSYYSTTVAGTAPPFASIEARCGSGGT